MGRFNALPTAAITDDSAVGGQIIQGSLIFDDDHSTFFHRDMVGGNRRTWTISYWTKLLDVNSTSSQRFWSAGDSGSGDVLKAEYYSGSSTRQIGFIDNNHAGNGIRFTTDAHLQDNAWYHIVMAVDTTLGTAANRVKIYINGELQTQWSSGSEHNHPPDQNYQTAMNKASLGLAFGRAYAFGAGSATHFEGQMAELYLVDGLQLEATDFGYTESQTGIWRPKKYKTPSVDNHFNWALNNNITDALNGTAFTENGGSSSFVSAGSNSFGLTNCLDISGDGKYLSYAITPASQWTIDFYVKLDNFTGANSYIGGWNGTGGSSCCVGVNKDNAPNYYFVVWGGGGNLYQTSVTVSLNTWYHIRMTTNATNDLKLYVNGTLVATDTSSNESPATPLTFGDMQSGRFNGQIAGVRYITRDLGAPPSGGLVSTNGVLPNADQDIKFGTNGFYYPLDGSHHITKDLSGNGNDSVPYNLRGTVPLHMATGGLPILNTNKGGTVVCPGVRPDPLASNIVLALPLSNRSNAIGFDVHHLIKGSGSAKTLTNSGSITNNIGYSNFYGRSGSAYISNANSQQIDISTSDDFNMGTGDFTVECWIYPNSTGASDGSLFVTHDGGSNTNTYFAFNFSPSTGRFNIYLNTGGAAWSPAAEEGMIEYTKWNHVALVKHSNVVKLYVNGLAIGSYSHSGQVGYTAGNTTICRIGGGGSSSLNVYMQDMRIYKGVAKYTDTFTCAAIDSSIIPDSPSGIAVPRKFRTSLSGSVGFEGTTSYLQIPNNSDLEVTNQDFCFEAYIYPTGASDNGFGYLFNKGYHNQITFRNNNNDPQMECYFASAGSGSYDIAAGFASGNNTVPLHQWSHVALTRSSGTLKWFINGVQKASQSAGALGTNSSDFTIGTYLGSPSNYEFKGSISNARVTVGEAVYTSNFTPSSEPLTLTSQGVTSSNVKLLCCKNKNEETDAEKMPSGSITRVNSAYATSFTPFDDDTISRASSYTYLNRLRYKRAGIVAEASLLLAGSNYTLQTATAIFGPGYITTGKYFWEVDNWGGTYALYSGITSEFDQGGGEIASQSNKTNFGSHYHKLFNQTSGVSRTNEGNGTMSFALDVDNRILRGYYNTRLIFTDTSIPNATTTDYAPFVFSTNGTWSNAHFNFGQRPFIFTPPEGYETISSAHIEPPTILNPKKHFESIVYSPNSGGLTVTGLEFKPDFIWAKSRNQAYHNYVFDSVRGTGAVSLRPSDTTPEPASSDATSIDEFLTNGFYIAGASGINDNGSGGNGVVAWCWKGGSPVTSSGGGVRFDGNNGTNLHIANNADIQIGSTSNWTIEFWLKRTAAYSDYDVIVGKGTSGTYEWFVEGFADGSVKFLYSNNGSTTWSGTHTIISSQALDRWYHIAIVRNGSGANNFKTYVDGSQTFQTTAFDINAGTANLDIGGYGGASGQDPKVVISNLRIVKGTSVYTSNFTKPSSPLTNITNTKLLCCQSIRNATEAAVSPGSITSNGGCFATSLNPFDAYSKDGVGYQSTADAGITEGTQPLTGASINTKAGFSILTYNGVASMSGTIGHGLNQAPQIYAIKSRDNTEEWRVYYTVADGSLDFMYLNTSDDKWDSGYSPPTSTLINKQDDNNEKMLIYAWHSVPGYSKIGAYYGNGQNDGKFVYTGFKPAFVLLKRHTDSANNWEIRDNKRVTNNPNNERLFPNRNDTKSVGEGVDFFNNGFKIRNSGSGSNSNDKRYIYMAFAEQPLTTQYGTQSNGE